MSNYQLGRALDEVFEDAELREIVEVIASNLYSERIAPGEPDWPHATDAEKARWRRRASELLERERAKEVTEEVRRHA